jgi:hypothetical protein
MDHSDIAFEEAVAVVATANSLVHLKKRLSKHPLVQYLAQGYSLDELQQKLIDEAESFDLTLHKATVVVLLVMALDQKLGEAPFPHEVRQSVERTAIHWAVRVMEVHGLVRSPAEDVVTLAPSLARPSPSKDAEQYSTFSGGAI